MESSGRSKKILYVLGTVALVLIIIGTTIGLVVYFKNDGSEPNNKQDKTEEKR